MAKKLSAEATTKLDSTYGELFDDIDVKYARIDAMHDVPVREDVLVPSDVAPGSDVELAARIWAMKQEEKDSSLNRFENPSDDELKQVLTLAAGYTGDWYHSVVVLVKSEPRPWSELEQAVRALPATGGVCLSFKYTSEDDESFVNMILADCGYDVDDIKLNTKGSDTNA